MSLSDRVIALQAKLKSASGLFHMDTAEANHLIDQGNVLEEEGRFEEALRQYERVCAQLPKFARAHLNLGNVQAELGQKDAAIASYRMALACDPHYAGAYFNLGNLYQSLNSAHDAIDCYKKSLAISSDYVEAHNNLGLAYLEAGDAQEAANSFHQAIHHRPNFAEAYYNLGAALHALGQKDAMVECCKKVLEIQPESARAMQELALAYGNAGQINEAIASYEKAQKLAPDQAIGYEHLGDLLRFQGRHEEALANYQKARVHHPDSVPLQYNIANALCELKRYSDAVIFYQGAIKMDAERAELHNGLGNAFRGMGRPAKAAESYRKAIALSPDFYAAHSNLGNVLRDLGQLLEASDCYERAIAIQPDFVNAHINFSTTLIELSRIEEAVASCRKALVLQADNISALVNLGVALKEVGEMQESLDCFARAIALDPKNLLAHSNMLFVQHYSTSVTAEDKYQCALAYGAVAQALAKPKQHTTLARDPKQWLRVGLLSADFRHHPVGFFIEGVLQALATDAGSKLDIYAYYCDHRSDALTEKIRSHCDFWYPVVGLSDEAVATKIFDDRIDILIDLSGHTSPNRLPVLAWRPAPVQVSWLGYFATTGVKEIDYLLADPHTLPADEEPNFTEKIWRLPETRLCFTAPEDPIDVGPLPVLKNGHITFGCFNNLTKMNAQVVALWSRVLLAVPESRLFLKSRQIKDEGVVQGIRGAFARCGIGDERLILEGSSPRHDYLQAYNRVDIALDPFPYTGGTTTVEALWMGVPVITLSGTSFLGRQGVGLLRNAGLAAWIAQDADDYVHLARLHARDTAQLAALRAKLRSQVLASPIYDAPRFARHLEDALQGMWAQHAQPGGNFGL